MVQHPEQWKWSSYSATTGKGKTPVFLSTEWVLRQFSQQKTEAGRQYIDFVQDGIITKHESPWQQLKGQVFFGGSQFIEQMQEKLGEKKEIGEIPRAQRYPARPSLPDLFKDVNSKDERNAKINIAHRKYGYTLKQIAEILGVHYATASRAARRSR